MRKVSQAIAHAFTERRRATISNTHTDGTTLYLHGNAIATHTPDGIAVSFAGWGTNTTRERLNALPGVRTNQKAGRQYINGEPADVYAWYIIREDGTPSVIATPRTEPGRDPQPARGFYGMMEPGLQVCTRPHDHNADAGACEYHARTGHGLSY